MTRWLPACRCPGCGRRPNVAYSEPEVHRAKRERQAARVTEVRCHRCGTSYWIRAQDIAHATPRDFFESLDPTTAAVLRSGGITTVDQVAARARDGGFGKVGGIGPALEREIREALDAAGIVRVA